MMIPGSRPKLYCNQSSVVPWKAFFAPTLYVILVFELIDNDCNSRVNTELLDSKRYYGYWCIHSILVIAYGLVFLYKKLKLVELPTSYQYICSVLF